MLMPPLLLLFTKMSESSDNKNKIEQNNKKSINSGQGSSIYFSFTQLCFVFHSVSLPILSLSLPFKLYYCVECAECSISSEWNCDFCLFHPRIHRNICVHLHLYSLFGCGSWFSSVLFLHTFSASFILVCCRCRWCWWWCCCCYSVATDFNRTKQKCNTIINIGREWTHLSWSAGVKICFLKT